MARRSSALSTTPVPVQLATPAMSPAVATTSQIGSASMVRRRAAASGALHRVPPPREQGAVERHMGGDQVFDRELGLGDGPPALAQAPP